MTPILGFAIGFGITVGIIVMVLTTGQTFGQRCARDYPNGPAVAVERCVEMLVHGGRS
jgi:hypothetical protein